MRVTGIPFVQGRNSYSDADGTKFGIAIHNTSNDASAENEASYAKTRPDGISAHFYADSDSVIQSLDTTMRAGHAGSNNGNQHAVAVEITGVNSWTRQQWLDRVAWDLLGRALAQVCQHYGIQVRRASVAEMKTNPKVRAFYSHNDMRLAWGGTTHDDPGPNFPWDRLFAAVNGTPSVSGGTMAIETGTQILQQYGEPANAPAPAEWATAPYTATSFPFSDIIGGLHRRVYVLYTAAFAIWAKVKGNGEKLDILLARTATNGQVTPSPEQWAALTATIEGLFATKVGAAAEIAAESAIRRVLGQLDGATPPQP